MLLFLLSILLLGFPFCVVDGQSTTVGCVWDLNHDLPQNDPLYYNGTGSSGLLIPSLQGMAFNLSYNITMVCPGKSNVIFGTGKQELTLPCVGNNMLLYNGQPLQLNNFECSASVLSELVITSNSCKGGTGTSMLIGFVSPTSGFVQMLDCCYDRTNEAALYSVSMLYGTAIKAAEIDSERPAFRTPGLTYGTTTANMYKQTEQQKRFNTLLGPAQTNKLLNTTSFLSRGHLSPDADYIFGLWSTASYFFVNAAPQWQVFNAGNWLKVESMTRDIAAQRNEDLVIFTGTHGVSQLPDDNGNLVNMYLLPNDKLPVPKWFWKVIYSQGTNEGIALIGLNNPHASSVSPTELLCPNICSSYNWNRPEWTQMSKGYTYCCEVNSLLAALGNIGPMTVSGVMMGPV